MAYTLGGILGHGNTGNVSNCYSIGEVRGSGSVGSILGYKDTNMTISNCYYLETLPADDNGISKSEGDMKGDTFVSLLDMDNSESVWKKDMNFINNGYPILNWQ